MAAIGEGQKHYFRNVCKEFRKTLGNTKEPEAILKQVETFINAIREVQWPSDHSKVEKAAHKVLREVELYIEKLFTDNEKTFLQNLLDTLIEMEDMASEIHSR